MQTIEIERKWQEEWKKAKIFEAEPDKRKKFFITVPYPYTSGPLHIGHGRSYTNGDIFARYMRMLGYNVLFPMAFHITGTPILSISMRIANNEKETINLFKEYVSLYENDPKKVKKIVESFKEPWNVANYFAEKMMDDFKSIGYSIDWRRRFTTGDKAYKAFVQWQFRKLKESGYLIKGSYPVLFCINCNNAVGEDDIKGGDVIKPGICEFYLLKFKFDDLYLVAATLRPETIFGVTNLWLNPSATYKIIQIDGEKWVVSEEAAFKLSKQNKELKEIGEIKASELIGKYCIEPMNKNKILILPAEFVDTSQATGVVYSVPSHAPFDYIGLVEIWNGKFVDEFKLNINEIKSIKPISLIKVKEFGDHPAIELCEREGIKQVREKDKLEKVTQELYKLEFYNGILKENCGKFAGKKVFDAKEEVFSYLYSMKLADKMYEVSAIEKPVVCRCGGNVIVSVISDQWFIDYGNEEWKNKARVCLDRMGIVPEIYRKLFEDTIAWLHERPCARRRGLGTPLPFDSNWIIESLSDSTIYMCFYIISKYINEGKIRAEQFEDKVFDYVFLGKGEVEDIEEDTGINREILKAMRKEFEYWYPVDQRHTAVGHISNHLTFYIFNHVAIFPSDKWPKKITLNEMLIREGRKMSKSYGNVLPLAEIPKKYSADLYRLYVSYAADLTSTLDWRENDIKNVAGKIERFYNILAHVKKGKFRKSMLKRWLISRFNRKIKMADECIKSFKIRDYIQHAFFDVLNDINHFERRETDKKEVNRFLYSIADEWIRLMSPVIPHLCEELWHSLGKKSFVSIEKWPSANDKLIDDKIELAEETIMNTHADIVQIIELIKKQPKKINLFIASEWKFKFLNKLIKIFNENKKIDFNFIMEKIKEEDFWKEKKEDVIVLLKKFVKEPGKLPSIINERNIELKAFLEAKNFFENEFKCSVEIIKEEKATIEKARQAMPGKPAIYVE
ncbi:MAG: leucine--tRNA ligase [Candidatus Parvarchaeota archaeon]|nr:leucine--tRNA ligase [Candidatus Jingweiarchaeum tengchongense]MCW1305222.1 leucine--tRNA ligase [Candidatus Jingweiarchaeum tengchongense]MCW1310670.1 leucine--tRNA ligase [Candidatus Jingweiarchaeum tengchongense]